MGRLIDQIWIIFVGSEHDGVPLNSKKYGGWGFFPNWNGMNDAGRNDSGKAFRCGCFFTTSAPIFGQVTLRAADNGGVPVSEKAVSDDVQMRTSGKREVIDLLGDLLRAPTPNTQLPN